MTNAVFTLLYNPNYLAGALVLGTTLKKLLSNSDTTSTVPPHYRDTKLGVLIDKSNFTPYQLQLLSNYYDELIDVSPLKSTIFGKLTYDLKRPELDKTFTKVKLWSLLQYEKILYLDSDTLPIIPIEESGGSILDLLALDFPKFKVLAAPDSGFPDIFNSGVFVLKPNLDDYSNLSALVKESATNPDVSFDGADQGLLNQYFNAKPDWVQSLLKKDITNISDINTTQDSNWIKIPFLYNVTPSAEYEYLPAFKHFQQPPSQPPQYGQPPAQAELEDHGGEQPTQDEEIWKTTVETLGRYHSTALLYINYRTTQVKLIHFIGPFKPWKLSSSITGIHKDWWKIWIEEFGEKSVPDVIYREQHPIQEPVPESTSQQAQTAGDESSYEVKVVEEYTEPIAPPPLDVSDPNTLLDPANYQQFEDNVQPTIDSMWDPTREPPPQHVEYHAPEGYENFDQSLKSFTNEWDNQEHHHHHHHHHHHDEPHDQHQHDVHHEPSPPPPPAPEQHYEPPPPVYHEEYHHHEEPHHEEEYHHHQHHEEEHHHHEEYHHNDEHHHHDESHHQHEEPFHQEEPHYEEPHHEEPHHEEPPVFTEYVPEERPDLYGHRYVKPERVFDNSNDYYPTHLLQELEKIDISKDADNGSGSQSPSSRDLASEVTSFNDMNEELSKEGILEETAFDEVYDEDKEGIEDDPDLTLEGEDEEEIPKLFPWEFRNDGKVTERVFDY